MLSSIRAVWLCRVRLLVAVGLVGLELLVEVVDRDAEAAGEGVFPWHALPYEAVVLEHRRHLALGGEIGCEEAEWVAVVGARLEAQRLLEVLECALELGLRVRLSD